MTTTRKRSRTAPAVGPFFEELNRLLESCTRDELIARIQRYASRLGDIDRRDLLAILTSHEAADAAADEAADAIDVAPDNQPSDATLIEEIDAFVRALENGDYVDGWGWDPDIRDERAWGDESWVEEMDDLFARADDAFFAGDRRLAREAYARLLDAFLLEEQTNAFCGPAPPEDMVETDLDAAKARYFRAIYDTEPDARRADALIDAAQHLRYLGSDTVGIRAVADADAQPLAGIDAFIERWIRALEDARANGVEGWERARKALLREAVEVRGGTAGLEAFARREGGHHPEAYLAWIEALAADGETDEALAAGILAIATVKDGPGRAEIADAVADLAAAHDKPDVVAAAAHAAWRAAPNANRLLRLCARHGSAPTALADALTTELRWLDTADIALPDALRAQVELLAGDVDGAAHRLDAAPPTAWSFRDHVDRIAVPALLATGAGRNALPPPAGSALAGLWAAMEELRIGRPTGLGAPEYTTLLDAALRRRRLNAPARLALLERAAASVCARVEAIVGGQHRGAYARAAELATACAEAYALAGKDAEARSLYTGLRKEYSRYYAFRRELNDAMRRSSVLRDRKWLGR